MNGQQMDGRMEGWMEASERIITMQRSIQASCVHCCYNRAADLVHVHVMGDDQQLSIDDAIKHATTETKCWDNQHRGRACCSGRQRFRRRARAEGDEGRCRSTVSWRTCAVRWWPGIKELLAEALGRPSPNTNAIAQHTMTAAATLAVASATAIPVIGHSLEDAASCSVSGLM